MLRGVPALSAIDHQTSLLGVHLHPSRSRVEATDDPIRESASYIIRRRWDGGLVPRLGTIDSFWVSPDWGGVVDPRGPRGGRREERMRLAKRIAIALGTLLAIMLAGGAHYRV